MTFSILALDPASGAIGGAAATGNLCVGGWVLRAQADVGASASQGKSVSTLWGEQALAHMAEGSDAAQALSQAIGEDSGAEHRQLSVLDASGLGAGWTGSENSIARGHLIGDCYVVAGNWLTSVSVLRDMEGAYKQACENNSLSFAQRLLDCLAAGVKAGSDSRGTLSAALKIVHRDAAPLDLRVDLDDEPLEKLRNLHARATSEPYAGWIASVPTVADPFRY